MLDYALKYASRGWSVFPLTGKRPLTEHGLKDATTSPETIRAWWQRWPSANVGIACGVSGLCVVDVDVKNGANGWESWRDLLAKLGLSEPDTLTCETPSGGGHVYFETQEPLRPSVGKLGPGLDVRAGASYVVAPPSKGYGWAMGCDLDRVALLPEPLAKEIQKNPAFEPSEAMSGMAIGARNVSLTRMAGALRRQGLDRDGLLSALQAINEAQCTPPLLSEEVARIAQSVAQYDPAPEHLTDLGNARRLVKRHGQDVRYCGPLGGWLVWDGKRWTVDATGAIERMAKETVAAMYDQAGQLTDQDERARLAGWAIKSESAQRIRAMIELARTEPGIMVKPEVFDCDPWLLNVDNGTVDLKTGQLREHNRADMITKLAPVAYDPNATDEMLTKYLSDTTGGDADFGAYLRKSCGYSLTGSTQEEVFFLMLGPAATGKSTLVEAMLTMLGDYGLKASFAAFLETRNAGGATPEIARLRGARMVAAVETSKGQRLNEPAIKELTGGDTVTARNLYAAPFSFKPACKLWLAANDAPRMTDTDTGLWRRLQRLPFEHELEARDPEVKARLCAEAGPALLAWAVQGCLLWQREGLTACDVVKAKTSELRATFDPLAEFFGEQCITDRQAETPALHLRLAYEQWAASMGARPINDREWSQRLKAAGCERRRTMHQGQKVTVWAGIGLIADMSPEDPWMAADTHGHTKPPFAQTFSKSPYMGDFAQNGLRCVHVCPDGLDQVQPEPLDQGYRGPASWHNQTLDQPVTVTGYAGDYGGEPYFTVSESSTALPGSQLTGAVADGPT